MRERWGSEEGEAAGQQADQALQQAATGTVAREPHEKGIQSEQRSCVGSSLVL